MRFSFSKWLKNLKQNSGLEVYSVWAKCIFDIPTATQTLALDLSGPSICMMYLQTSKHTPTPQPFSGSKDSRFRTEDIPRWQGLERVLDQVKFDF